jgi:hypothetical protein
MRIITPESRIASERLSRVLDYWRGKARRRLPARGDIQPTELRGDLPAVWLAEVIDGGADFGFRLAGEDLRQFLGAQYHGKLLSACPKTTFFANVRKVFSLCVEARLPVITGPAPTTHEARTFQTISVLVLPLAEDGQDVTMLFGAFELAATADHGAAVSGAG